MKGLKKVIIKSLSVVLVVVLTLTSAPLSGFVGLELPEWLDFSINASAASGTCGENLTWSFDEVTGTLTISGTGAMYDWDSDSDSHPWINYINDITSVVINNGVTTIGENAFGSCISLTNITIPDSVTIISDSAFNGCTNLIEVTLGDNVITIGEEAFYDCTSLANIIIPDSVTTIDNRAFCGCTNLIEVTLGNNVITIGESAFNGCTSLTSVEIPASVTSIGFCAFYYCSSLANISVESKNQYYSSGEYGELFNKDKTTLIQCSVDNTRTSYIIPNGVITIYPYAFISCTNLTSITIPNSVTTIVYSTFFGCTSLTSITIPNSVTTIEDYAFFNCVGLTDVYYSGTEEQWNAISIGSYNDPLLNATIHYNSTGSDSNNENCSKCGGAYTVDSKTIAPTCTTDGYIIYTCTSCGNTYTEVINALGHDMQETTAAVAPTCEAAGSTAVYTCANGCGETEGGETIKALGHDYVDGVCSYCGENESEGIANNGTYTGMLESTVWTVTDSENWASEITVNGLKYIVKKNLITTETGASAENKEVVFVVKNGEVVWFDTCENIKAGINVGISLSESEITYYDGKFGQDKLMVKVAVSSTCSSRFPGDISVLNSILNADLALEDITISASEPLNFNGSKTYSIDASSIEVEFGKTVIAATIYANLDNKYMKDSLDLIYSGVSCNVSGIQNSSRFNESASTSLLIKKLASTKPSSNQNSTSSVNNAAQKLETISGTNAVNINGDITGTLNKLFTAEERDMIGATLLTEAALICIPEEKLDLSSKVFESMMGIKSSWFGTIHNEEVSVTFVSNTDEYGEIEVKFTCDLYNVDISNSKIGFYGNINYEIVGGKGKKNLTDDMSESGLAGGLAGADVTTFANAVYSVANEMLDNSYEFGDTANDAAEIVFGETVDEILRQTKYGKYLSVIKKVIFAGKEIIIECPVDVYIYNSNNELVAAVENNEVILTNEFAQISVEGDVKTVWLYDDTYRIEYCSLAEHGMSVTIKEYGYSNCLLRTVRIKNIPLKIGTNFEQFIDKSVLEETNYSITSNENQTYSPIEDVCHLHKHETTMEWEDIQEATCTQYGIKVAICDLCNDWYKEIIPATGHSYENGSCMLCGTKDPTVPEKPEYNYTFSIQTPSRTEIRNKDGIILHANIDGTAPAGSYVKWESSNGNFDEDADGNDLTVIAKNKGYTTFTAILCDADGNELARDSIEMYSKSGFFDKIGGFFRSLFGTIKIYEN